LQQVPYLRLILLIEDVMAVVFAQLQLGHVVSKGGGGRSVEHMALKDGLPLGIRGSASRASNLRGKTLPQGLHLQRHPSVEHMALKDGLPLGIRGSETRA
jgi:hypothetical protein